MVKIKVVAYWTDPLDRERDDVFYVDEYNENTKRLIYNWVRSYFVKDIPSDKKLEKYYDLHIDVEGAVFICDLCGLESEKLYTISFLDNQKDYGVCPKCFQKVENSLEQFREENLKWRT